MASELAALTADVSAGNDLDPVASSAAAHAMADDTIPDGSKEAFLIALARKGETAQEVIGFARTYRGLARRVDFCGWPATGIDIVGTGGDRSGSFNISSASALVVAAAGVPVLKHGNRSITSQCGSADFLSRLGIALEASDSKLLHSLQHANFCYLHAPAFHPAFKAVAKARKNIAEIGLKTVFNILGPLINPAQPAHMLVGVFHERWVEPVAAVLGELGVKRGLVTHCRAGSGMDEITTAGQVRVRGCGELSWVDAVWLPADFGFKECSMEELRGGTPEENVSTFQRLLQGDVAEGLMDTICLTAGAALWVAGRAEDAAAGARRARDIILGGQLQEQVRRLQECHRAD